MIAFIKQLIRMVNNYDIDRNEVKRLDNRANKALERAIAAELYLKQATTIDADISTPAYGSNTVIVMGRYHGRDHVEVVTMNSEDFERTIDEIKHREKHASVRHVDAPIGMKFII